MPSYESEPKSKRGYSIKNPGSPFTEAGVAGEGIESQQAADQAFADLLKLDADLTEAINDGELVLGPDGVYRPPSSKQ